MKGVAGVLMKRGGDQVCVIDDDGELDHVIKIRGNMAHIVKCRREEEDGPIIITDMSRGNNNVHLVLAVGDKCKSGVKALDKILTENLVSVGFRPGYETKTEFIIKEDDILAILEGDDEDAEHA